MTLRVLVIALAVLGVPLSGAQDRRLTRETPSGSERRLALVVGNDTYATSPLTNAVNDARAVEAALRGVGFTVTLATNASLEAMDRTVDAFVARVQPGDVTLFYYAGHAVQVAGENYLIPTDFRGGDTVTLRRRTTSVSEVQERLTAQGARLRILILDACRDNPYAGSRSGAGGLAQYNAEGALIAYATAPGRTASDNAGGTNGLFTTHFLKALKTPGLKVSDLFRQVRQVVRDASNGQQVPWVSDGVIGDFWFVPATTPPPAPPDAVAEPLALRAELTLWDAIKDSSDPSMFDDYLKQYPSGRFRVVAQSRLAALRTVPAPAPSPRATVDPPANENRVASRAAPLLNLTGAATRGSGANREWLSYTGDKSATRYSPVEQITPTNIANVGIAWRQPGVSRAIGIPLTSYDHTPVMIGGSLYVSTPSGSVLQIDPVTGALGRSIVPPDGVATGAQPTHAIAYWTDGRDPRLITVGHGSLTVFSERSGRLLWEVPLGHAGERNWSNLTPLVVNDVIVIGGVSGGEKELDSVAGYDVRTAKLLWTFNPIPRPGQFGADTWSSDSWQKTTGHVGWSAISADEQLGLLYVTFDTPAIPEAERPGNNLFANSLVCLNARTGARVWHFQLVHHAVTSAGLPAAPILADVKVDGRPRKVVAQLSSEGFVYVFDRATGQPIWPIQERPVRERTAGGSPTQPIPTKPPAFDASTFTSRDLADFTPEIYEDARQLTTRPGYVPPERLASAAFDPDTGLLIVSSARTGGHLSTPGSGTLILGRDAPSGLPDPYKPPYSRVSAFDLGRGEMAWSTVNGDGPRDHPALKELNLPAMGAPGLAVPLVTRHLVFLGHNGRVLRAYDKRIGKLVWERELPGDMIGAPMAYMAGGRVYVVVTITSEEGLPQLIALALP